jgi:hypothetical protein
MEDNEIFKNAVLLVNSALGVYVPETFAKRYPEFLNDEQKADLSNHENEFYWETWENVLDNVRITIDGKRYSLYQEDDLWGLPESAE